MSIQTNEMGIIRSTLPPHFLQADIFSKEGKCAIPGHRKQLRTLGEVNRIIPDEISCKNDNSGQMTSKSFLDQHLFGIQLDKSHGFMKFMAMKLRFVLFAIALSAIFGCQADKSKLNPIGLWADSTGMALFEVRHEKGEAFSVSSSIGSLKGKWIDGSVRGVTDLNDSFSMSILSDSTAVYSVLGVQIEYRRVSQAKYDSLAKLLAQ